MRLSLQKNPARWRITEMQEIHLDFLRLAADDASMNDCPGGRERLYPPPVSQDDLEEEDELVEDWKEFVTAELEIKFVSDVGNFLSDLDEARAVRRISDEARPKQYRLDIPLEHGMAWFSTLNQARLLLDLKFKLHAPPDDPATSTIQEQLSENDDAVRLLVLMRYEFYAWIQEWLVRHVL